MRNQVTLLLKETVSNFCTGHSATTFLFRSHLREIKHRRCFILNCQIYHHQCRKGSDMLIKFTTTARNHSKLSNVSHHILTGGLLHKTQRLQYVHVLLFFSDLTEYTCIYSFGVRAHPSGSFRKKVKKVTNEPRDEWWLQWVTSMLASTRTFSSQCE